MSPENTNPPVEFEERLAFETLISDLSSRFINVPPGEVDRDIEDALRRVCELLGIDFSVLWQWSSAAPGVFTATHLYCAQGRLLSPERLRQDLFPWVAQQMLAGCPVIVPSVEELPAEAAVDRESARRLGIKSDLCLPLSVGGEPLVGALAFNTLRAERDWPDALVKRLQLVAQVFANALARRRADQALRESEENSRATFDQAAVGIAHVGTNGRWLRVNDKLCAIVGYPRDELLQLTFQDITHPDDLETDLDYVRQVLAGEIKTYSMEKRYIRKDRSVVWINLTVSLVRGAAGEPRHFISVVEDITDRKRAEEAFRASEARLAAGADLAGLGCYEVDFGERACFMDDRFQDICGVPPDLQQGLGPVEFWMAHLHPDDRQRVLDEREKLHDGRLGQLSIEYRYVHPTHGQKWIHQVARVTTRSATGRTLRTFSVVRDVTETKRLSERLRSSAEEWQKTFDSINDLVMILDPAYRIVRVNAATVRFLGLPMERIIGGACCTLVHGTSCPIDGCPCQTTLHARPSAELELFHAASGKWLLFSTDPIQDAAGNVIGAVHVGRDITEAKRAEAELLQQRTELAHIARVSAMGELAASLAHELNQPLGAILANTETAELLLQQDPLALGDMRAILADIRKDDERAGEVIRRMRALLGKRELERQPLEINALVQDVCQVVSGDATLRGISLTADLAPALPEISGDRVHLQQVLLNLLLNGMDALAGQPRERRRILVRTRVSVDGQVELAVIDSGHGIEPGILPRLFEPFFTTKPNGMGMGLSISRTIIEAHGGRIWVENDTSGGAAFRIVLSTSDRIQAARADSVSSAPLSTEVITP